MVELSQGERTHQYSAPLSHLSPTQVHSLIHRPCHASAISECLIDFDYLFIDHGDLIDSLVRVSHTILKLRHTCLQDTPRFPESYQRNLTTLQIVAGCSAPAQNGHRLRGEQRLRVVLHEFMCARVRHSRFTQALERLFFLHCLTPMQLQSKTGNKLQRLLLRGITCPSEDMISALRGFNKPSHLSVMYVRKKDAPPLLDDFLGKVATRRCRRGYC